MNNNFVAVDKLRFWFVITIASIAGLVGDFFTSGGWSIFFVLVYYSLFYLGASILFFWIGLVYRSSYTVVSKKTLLALFGSFVLVLLFNRGDCGDAEGIYTFIFSVFDRWLYHGAHLCGSPTLLSQTLSVLWLGAVMFHIAMFVYVFIQHLKIDTTVTATRGTKFVFILLAGYVGLVTLLAFGNVAVQQESRNELSEWGELQAGEAVKGAPYYFSFIPPYELCVKTPNTSAREVLAIADKNGVPKPDGGYWELRYTLLHPLLRTQDDLPTSCLWYIKAHAPGRLGPGYFETESVAYVVNDIDGSFHTIQGTSGMGSGIPYPLYYPE